MNNVDNLVAEKAYLLDCLVNKFPTGIFSYVMDSYDYFGMLSKVLPSIKDEIMQREGKFVVRGDSGDPVDIICGFDESKVFDFGYEYENEDLLEDIFELACERLQAETDHGVCGDSEYTLFFKNSGKLYKAEVKELDWNRYDKQYYYLDAHISSTKISISEVERTAERKGTIEILWEIFGGTVNEQGYKVLDPHIGMIYGDGITPQRQKQILQRLKAKGFASTNIVFGVGSYSLNMLSRDHLGIAVKATNQIVEIAEGVVLDQPIYKDPKTDSSKKSARGLLSVHEENGTLVTKDMQTRKQENTGLLNTLYMNGQFHKLTTVFEIRDKIWK